MIFCDRLHIESRTFSVLVDTLWIAESYMDTPGRGEIIKFEAGETAKIDNANVCRCEVCKDIR